MGHMFASATILPHPAASPLPLQSISGVDAISRYAASLQDVTTPVAPMAADYASGSTSHRHSHRRAQLLHSLSGVMTVMTEQGSWVVPPQKALWVPPGVVHQSRCWGDVQLRTLYIEPAMIETLPKVCCIIEVSPLLRALINEAVTFPLYYDMAGREGQIIALTLSEIGRLPQQSLQGAMPRDARLLRICEAVLRNPADDHDLDYWARVGGLGRRTLTRLFRQQTGLSFAEWRQQLRLLEALTRLTTGESVTSVALDLGYDSPSAFSAMFRKTLGISPKDYLKWSETAVA